MKGRALHTNLVCYSCFFLCLSEKNWNKKKKQKSVIILPHRELFVELRFSRPQRISSNKLDQVTGWSEWNLFPIVPWSWDKWGLGPIVKVRKADFIIKSWRQWNTWPEWGDKVQNLLDDESDWSQTEANRNIEALDNS